MDTIQLLTVENCISRKHGLIQQKLVFYIVLDHLSYDKKIDIVWAGEDRQWHVLPAHFHSKFGPDKEYWRAEVHFDFSEDESLPGNIRFALRYQIKGKEYWDNNQGFNYSSQADSGIKVCTEQRVQNVDFAGYLAGNQHFVPVKVAVDPALQAKTVTLHWTTDNWRTINKTPCTFHRTYWNEECGSNARNPNQYGVQLWQGRLKVANAFKVQYCIACDTGLQTIWDNNDGHNYFISREPLKLLILNLHCYQEDNQDDKFSQIAKAIGDLKIDVVCLQEVAELWNDGQGDSNSNSARIINSRLPQPYHCHTDWAHLGFDKYRESVAVLSRYPFLKQDSRYVSASNDAYDIHARKVVMAQLEVPFIGLVNVFSAHLSWWEDGFEQQFRALGEWARSLENREVKASLLCGDFNIKAGSSGYQQVVNDDYYQDQYLAANTPEQFYKIFIERDRNWPALLNNDHRIDYVFMNKASELQVASGRVLFDGQDYGKVSDHVGYLLTFEPK